MAILAILMTVGVRLAGGSGYRSRKVAADMLAGMTEQARTTAITSRCCVVLAVEEPGDVPGRDRVCRLGLFKMDSRSATSLNALSGVMVGRWRTLEPGVVLTGGRVGGLENPLDSPKLTISYRTNRPRVVRVRALVFTSRGGLQYPAGSSPVVMRVAEGNYRGGKATPFMRGDAGAISESVLRIGRVTARAYRIDG